MRGGRAVVAHGSGREKPSPGRTAGGAAGARTAAGRSGVSRCGTVALVGRPNVGKSTLLNHLIGQKLSITSRKPQTTRNRIRGILTRPETQFVFVDTPGYQTRHKSALNRAMNRSVLSTLQEVDVVLMVSEALHWGAEDQRVLDHIPAGVRPLLVVNKVDRVKPRELLLPFLRERATESRFDAIVPVSARQDRDFEGLLREIEQRLPEGPPMYEADDLTDSNERFLAAEFIREQLFRLLGEELPYATTVLIDQYQTEGALRRIHATIVVDNDNQKAIVIGRNGEKLKAIGTLARKSIETLVQGKVHLELWV
ncbi:MAG: GTPase Era, partial [Betaproteobacteria bacterium]|nr:GTPase Era [Betaproteobacteria bacterium]